MARRPPRHWIGSVQVATRRDERSRWKWTDPCRAKKTRVVKRRGRFEMPRYDETVKKMQHRKCATLPRSCRHVSLAARGVGTATRMNSSAARSHRELVTCGSKPVRWERRNGFVIRQDLPPAFRQQFAPLIQAQRVAFPMRFHAWRELRQAYPAPPL